MQVRGEHGREASRPFRNSVYAGVALESDVSSCDRFVVQKNGRRRKRDKDRDSFLRVASRMRPFILQDLFSLTARRCELWASEEMYPRSQ
jgi:hypothetical protein